MVYFLNACTYMLKHRSENANANVDVLSCLPLLTTAEALRLRYRVTDPSDLDVYLEGTSEIHPSRLRTSSHSSLDELANASSRPANDLGGLAVTPDGVFSVRGEGGGGGSSARAQKDREKVRRAASKKFLTEDEAQPERWQEVQMVHPRLTCALQEEERSTEILLNGDSSLEQPTIRAFVKEQL